MDEIKPKTKAGKKYATAVELVLGLESALRDTNSILVSALGVLPGLAELDFVAKRLADNTELLNTLDGWRDKL